MEHSKQPIPQKILVKGEDKTDDIRSWRRNGDKIDITYSSGKTYPYSEQNVRFVASALAKPSANKCFEYLTHIAQEVGLKDPDGNNILANRYAKIDFVSEDCMLSAFLLGKLNLSKTDFVGNVVYPFGFNISQKQAVDNALSSPLSIIEGPPGTGKTQTILNIIANAVMRGESVAVVSGNNSATANVLEKLQKSNIEFIAAYLGNSENKRAFIELQKPLPDLSTWKLLPERRATIQQQLQTLFISLGDMLVKKNELSRLKQKLGGVELEYKHFTEYYNENNTPVRLPVKENINSEKALKLWLLCEHYAETDKKPGWFGRLINRFRYSITDKSFYNALPEILIAVFQKRYYETKIQELTVAISTLEKNLATFDFDGKMDKYSKLSVEIFRDKLAEKYGKNPRKQFDIDDLRKNSEEFIAAYPVILSTTYSLQSSLSNKVMYDYVIIDESSQVDLATGALALSCAKKAVVVGDLKQLPNVVDRITAEITDKIFDDSSLPEVYRYKNHSLLSAIMELFPNAPHTLLREHYRCHPKIIDFCNQKFYNGSLIILTEPKSERQPLVVYQTVEGNHARDHVNQRQIDVIKQEVIPQQKLDVSNGSIGIVTPYRNQTNALQSAFSGTAVKADTVDKFQGRENKVIVISTVDNEVGEFTDNANRLNVAVSRAIEQLIVVVSANDIERDTNIGDLVRYIKYNNMEVIKSEIYSVFDYLYDSYAKQRKTFLAKHKRVSAYDSENLMFALISEVLKDERFLKYGVAVHVPLKMIIRDPMMLNDDEARYAMNILTHVDFLIFNKLDKIPQLIVEVDGTNYHKAETRQAERDKLKNGILEKYGLPYIRCRTNESGEKRRIINELEKRVFVSASDCRLSN
jgi:superfamily I DNA and/or RNA helicase